MNNFSNILLAEDDSADYLFFKEALEKISGSYKVTHAKNGLECMRFLKNEIKPDLIFLDLNMPGYNGLDCLKFIKANENLIDIPVIIYSTSHYIKHIDNCYKNEAHFYIVKPACSDLLSNILKQVFSSLHESVERPVKENFVVGAWAASEKLDNHTVKSN